MPKTPIILYLIYLLPFISPTIIVTDDFLDIVGKFDINGIFANANLLKTNADRLNDNNDPTATTCKLHLEKMAIFFTSELKSLGFKEIPEKNRTSRSIKPLGELLSWASGIPGPASWQREVEVTHQLEKIANDEASEIFSIKNSIEKGNTFLNDLKAKITNLVSEEVENSNSITSNSEKLNEHINAELICDYALSIAESIREQLSIVKNIIYDSKFNLPNLHLFPFDKVSNILDENSISKKYLRDYYRMTSATYTIFKNTIIGSLSIPDLPEKKFKSKVVYHLANKNYLRLAPLEIFSQKPLDIMICDQDSRNSIIISSFDLKRCQRSTNKDFHICKRREIILKNDSPETCSANKIAKVVVFQMNNDEQFLVEGHSGSISQLICNHRVIKSVNITETSLINVPNFCTLENFYFTISKTKEHTYNKSIDESFEIVRKFPNLLLEKRPFHPHSLKNDSEKIKKDQAEFQNAIDEMDEKNTVLKNAVNNNTEWTPYLHGLSGSAIGISTTLLILGIVILIFLCIFKNTLCGI